MIKSSCHSNASAPSDCLRKSCCAPTQERTGSVIIWIVALDEHTVQLFVHQPGRPIEPMSAGCCCGVHAGNLDNLAKYLDAALACGKYDGLVLIGPEQALKAIKKRLSAATHNRVIAEIFEDALGKNPHEIAQRVAERVAL